MAGFVARANRPSAAIVSLPLSSHPPMSVPYCVNASDRRSVCLGVFPRTPIPQALRITNSSSPSPSKSPTSPVTTSRKLSNH